MSRISLYLCSLLRRCETLRHGQSLHSAAIKTGLSGGADPYFSAALVAMYCARGAGADIALKAFDEDPAPPLKSSNAAVSSLFRAGHCAAARSIFDRMPCRNAVSWSAAIAGYAQNRRPLEALVLFERMPLEETTSQSLSAALAAAAAIAYRRLVAQLHARAAKLGFYDAFIGSALVHAYGSCWDISLARQVFDEMPERCVVAWSSLMAGFLKQGSPSAVLALFKGMVWEGAALPNEFTIATALSACARVPDLVAGRQLHAYLIRRQGRARDVFVSSALIDMYCKTGSLGRAMAVFEPEARVIGKKATPLWNTMIAGYVANGQDREAWRAVRAMAAAARPNAVTLAVLLPLMAGRFLRAGKEVHCYAIRMGLVGEILVGNSLLDMYCKCGDLSGAMRVFDAMPERNRISWTTIVNGHGRHGSATQAVTLFRRMAAEPGISPDGVTLVAVISACGHGGLVEEGLGLVKELTEAHGLELTAEAHGAVVDLLARAGRLEEAAEWAMTAMVPGKSALGALLGGCRIHGEVNQAESTAQRLAVLEPEGTGFPTLLSSIYFQKGMVDQAVGLRTAMSEKANQKIGGCSWLETSVKVGQIESRVG